MTEKISKQRHAIKICSDVLTVCSIFITGKMGTNGKACGKIVPTAEHSAVACHLINIANKLSSLVTREDLEYLKPELRLV